MRRLRRARGCQSGMTLIDVLVSILLVSIGMIGLLGLLATTTKNGNNAQDRNRAALLANELATDMWLNNSTNVTAGPLAADFAAWQGAVVAGLYPNAVGAVTMAGPVATITITWTPPNQSASNSASTVNAYDNQVVNNTYSTQVVLP